MGFFRDTRFLTVCKNNVLALAGGGDYLCMITRKQPVVAISVFRQFLPVNGQLFQTISGQNIYS